MSLYAGSNIREPLDCIIARYYYIRALKIWFLIEQWADNACIISILGSGVGKSPKNSKSYGANLISLHDQSQKWKTIFWRSETSNDAKSIISQFASSLIITILKSEGSIFELMSSFFCNFRVFWGYVCSIPNSYGKITISNLKIAFPKVLFHFWSIPCGNMSQSMNDMVFNSKPRQKRAFSKVVLMNHPQIFV